jgi:hypothetical protein
MNNHNQSGEVVLRILKLQGGRHSECTLLDAESSKGFLYEARVEETQFEVEYFISWIRRRQPTLATFYLVRDKQGSGIIAPKWYDYEDLMCYVPIETEEV